MDWLEWIKQFPQQYLGQIKEGMIGAGEAGPLLGGGIVATALDPAWPLIQQTAEKVAETAAPALTRGLNQQAVNYNMAMDSLREAGHDIPDYRMPESDEMQNRAAMVAAMTAAGGAFRGKIPFKLHTKVTRNWINNLKKRWKTDDDVQAIDLELDNLKAENLQLKRDYNIPDSTRPSRYKNYTELGPWTGTTETRPVLLPPEVYEGMMVNEGLVKDLEQAAKYLDAGGTIEAPIEIQEARAKVPEVIEPHVPEDRLDPGSLDPNSPINAWHSFPDKIYTDFDSFIPEGTILGGTTTSKRPEILISDVNYGSPESQQLLKENGWSLTRYDDQGRVNPTSLYDVAELNAIKRQHNIPDGVEALIEYSDYLADQYAKSFEPVTKNPLFEGLSDEAKEVIEASEERIKFLEHLGRQASGGRRLKAEVGATSKSQALSLDIARNDRNIEYLQAGGKLVDERVRVVQLSGEAEKKFARYKKIQDESFGLQEKEYQGTITDEEFKKLQRYRDKTLPDLIEYLSEKLPNMEF